VFSLSKFLNDPEMSTEEKVKNIKSGWPIAFDGTPTKIMKKEDYVYKKTWITEGAENEF
jgi:hypothetical protein